MPLGRSGAQEEGEWSASMLDSIHPHGSTRRRIGLGRAIESPILTRSTSVGVTPPVYPGRKIRAVEGGGNPMNKATFTRKFVALRRQAETIDKQAISLILRRIATVAREVDPEARVLTYSCEAIDDGIAQWGLYVGPFLGASQEEIDSEDAEDELYFLLSTLILIAPWLLREDGRIDLVAAKGGELHATG